nr:hypothetical protein [Candidatus Sigynarchaeota archaeon]
MPSQLSRIMCKIKELYPSNVPENEVNLNTCDMYFEESRFNDNPYLFPIAILKTQPCSWFLEGGGCTVCGYNHPYAGYRITDDNIRNQIEDVIKRANPKIYPQLTVTSTGSLLDKRELPDALLGEVLGRLREAGYSHFNFE